MDNKSFGGVVMSKRLRLTLAYACSMLALTIFNIVISVVPSRMSNNGLNIFYTLISQIVCMGAIPLIIAVVTNPDRGSGVGVLQDMRQDFLYKKPRSPKVWLLVVPISILFYFFTVLVSRVYYLIVLLSGYTPTSSAGIIYGGPFSLVMWIAIGAVLPAIFEEFTHRGLLVSALRNRGNEIEVIFLSALLFGAMHGNIVQFGYAFVGGLIMGYLAVKTNSIFPAMLLHFMNNATDHIIQYSTQKGGSIGRAMTYFNNMTSNPFTLLIAASILLANAALIIYLLTLIPKFANAEPAIREKTFLKGRFSLDAYRIDGKPTIMDNIMIYAVMVMLLLQTAFTYVWGQLR